jgi:hypothetical protein
MRSTYTIMSSVASDTSYDAEQLQFEFSPEASIESIEFDPEPDVMYYVDMLQTQQRLKQEIEQLKAQLLAKQQEFDAQQLVIDTIKSKLGVAK